MDGKKKRPGAFYKQAEGCQSFSGMPAAGRAGNAKVQDLHRKGGYLPLRDNEKR